MKKYFIGAIMLSIIGTGFAQKYYYCPESVTCSGPKTYIECNPAPAGTLQEDHPNMKNGKVDILSNISISNGVLIVQYGIHTSDNLYVIFKGLVNTFKPVPDTGWVENKSTNTFSCTVKSNQCLYTIGNN